jgi:hypothetical protein
MNAGLTIAFICSGNKHPTVENYKKFGKQFWDDTQNNNSKVGYYFVYYFQQKYVYIHKIINILQPSERPIEMNWTSDRQILCLSSQLKQFTWNEWIHNIGFGAPYTPNYRMTQTGSWSHYELQNHIKYKQFNFTNFINIIENQTTTIASSLPIKYDDEEDDKIKDKIDDKIKEIKDEIDDKDIMEDIMEDIDDEKDFIAKRKAEIALYIKVQEAETTRLLMEKRLRKNIEPLRQKRMIALQEEKTLLMEQFKILQEKINDIDVQCEEVGAGNYDEELIKTEQTILHK